jgi:enoyl-CoA hydratase/carnithine racemase
MTRDQVRILLDAMIPGQDNRWPAASDVIDADRMAESLEPHLVDQAETMPQDVDEAFAWLSRLAAEAPAMMRAVTEVVYSAYYTSPAVQAVIRDLAEAGPRDPAPRFDEALLAQVRARAAQQRRP